MDSDDDFFGSNRARLNSFYEMADRRETELLAKLDEAEDATAVMGELEKLWDSTRAVDALRLKVAASGGWVDAEAEPQLARLANICDKCVARGGALGEHVPFGQLANLLSETAAAACNQPDIRPVDADRFSRCVAETHDSLERNLEAAGIGSRRRDEEERALERERAAALERELLERERARGGENAPK
ncbi:MAG: hypothetical protein LBI39_02155 [Puniceicoccales bacterium]|jgi:hypothetical protein|nr:hypothetical protein [Puniceicoccales bacterium]